MTRPKDNSNSTPPPERFSEAAAWRDVGAGWQRLFGNFQGVGFSIEWHDFLAHREFDWASSFHPNSIELCLNLAGHGFVAGAGTRAEFTPGTAGFYFRREEPLTAGRAAGQRHQFLTVEFSRPFLDRHLAETKTVLHPVVRAVLEDSASKPAASTPVRLTTAQMETIATLRQPPVAAAVQPVWYQCKALELAVTFLVQADQEFFCTRQQRLAGERVDQVRFLLSQNLAAPPSLEELGKKIGCSHFYLSRIFSAQTGQTITQYLRQLRMERAAELLKTREYNVTEVATEVGYNSLSHFSAAFQETFGCCPGLYPMATTTQKSLPKKSS